jgi:hypothetical protein
MIVLIIPDLYLIVRVVNHLIVIVTGLFYSYATSAILI